MILPVTSCRPRTTPVLVLVGLALAGTLVAAAPPSAAASNTLTVVTLDRSGRAVRSQYAAMTIGGGPEQYQWSGSAHRLARGTYEVFVAIPTIGQSGDTVAVKRVRVSGATRLTIDARQGRPVRGQLSPALPSGFFERTSVWVCTADGIPMSGGSAVEGPAYAVPSSLRDVEFAFATVWSADRADGHGATYYAGAAAYEGGVPPGMRRTFRRAELADLTVRGRTGLQSGDAQIYVRYGHRDGCRAVTLQLFPQATLPYALAMHVPAGYWSVGQFAQDSIYGPARWYGAGHPNVATIGAAAWGPAGSLPEVDQYCRCLIATTSEMFADPSAPSGAGARVAYTLRRRGSVIARRVVDPEQNSVTVRLPGRGWYSLTESATRHPIKPLPPGALSPRTVLRLRFFADPARTMQVGGYLTKFVPFGLGIDNRARTRTTTVALALVRPRLGPGHDRSAVKALTVWMSPDGGRSWRQLVTHHVDGRWRVTIANPASGYVSLRAKVMDTNGNAATTEILRAYAIG